MKTIQATDLTDEHWKLYAQFEEELNKNFYPEEKNKKPDWQDLKRDRITDLETLKEDFLSYYLFFENEKVTGFLGVRLIGDDAEFALDSVYDELPKHILNEVFDIVKKFMSEKNKTEINTYARRPGLINSLTKAGGIVYDRKIFVRLMRENIDKNYLLKTVESMSKEMKYKLELYDTIHEEILDRYVDIYNDARIDMNQFNPNKPVIVKRTREDVIKKLKWDKGPRDKMFMYMLFDKENIAAFCSLFIREENKHMIDQAGGLTTVGRNYRGQNLAKFLKSKIYLKMLEEYPDFEFIRTDTYPWNKYMYRINEEFGFKPYEEYAEMKFQF